jgi:hypothetical protein
MDENFLLQFQNTIQISHPKEQNTKSTSTGDTQYGQLDFITRRNLSETQRTRRIPTLLPGKEIRRRVMGKLFGVDFGGGGERGLDIV